MDAALDLIAERGEEGVTLRELTDAADANVAAVSYHFGSLKSLCDAAIEHALERYLDAQAGRGERAAPRVDARGIGGGIRPADDQGAGHGRSGSRRDPHRGAGRDRSSGGWDRLDARFDQIRADVLRVLKANVPDVRDPELILRTRCAAGMLNWLPSRPSGRSSATSPRSRSSDCWSRYVAGAFRGTSPADRQPAAPRSNIQAMLDKLASVINSSNCLN